MEISATYDGSVFVPVHPVDLPVGRSVTVVVDTVLSASATSAASIETGEASTEEMDLPLMKLYRAIQHLPVNDDWPTDGASQTDHYLYGAPKRP